jgi:hypothetical protein
MTRSFQSKAGLASVGGNKRQLRAGFSALAFMFVALVTACHVDALLSSGDDNSGNSSNPDPPGGGSVTLTATHLEFVVHPGNATIGETVTPPIQVAARDQTGATAQQFSGSITLELAANPGNGALAGTLTRTAVSGVATFDGISIDKAGTGYRLGAISTNLSSATSNTFNITAPPPTVGMQISSGNGQTGVVGTPLPNPYVVSVRNSLDAPVAGVSISWTVETGGGSIAASSTTSSSGLASATHTLGPAAGTQRVRASATGTTGSPLIFESTATLPPPSRILLVSGNNQTDTVAATLIQPYVVRVTDAAGNPVIGVIVSWSTTGTTDGSISPATSQTNANGQASAVFKLGTRTGPHTVSASANGLQGSPVQFTSTATHGTASRLAFVQQPTDTREDRNITPEVRVAYEDNFGNTVTSASAAITVSIVPLTGHLLARLSGRVTDEPTAGVCNFNNLRIDRVANGYRLRAIGGGLSVDSAPFNITRD